MLRRRRSLEAAAGAAEPRALIAAALVRVFGLSGRALEGLFEAPLLARIRALDPATLPAAVRADLPDWLWERLVSRHGEREATLMAQGLLNAAPLDLRVNLARIGRDEALARLARDGLSVDSDLHGVQPERLAFDERDEDGELGAGRKAAKLEPALIGGGGQ